MSSSLSLQLGLTSGCSPSSPAFPPQEPLSTLAIYEDTVDDAKVTLRNEFNHMPPHVPTFALFSLGIDQSPSQSSMGISMHAAHMTEAEP